MKKSVNPIAALPDFLARKGGILLDIACGDNKQPGGFVGMDKRNIPGIVDIIHDLEVFPYPLPDESCLTIIGSHIVEHIKPWLFIDFMNELWRILKVEGQLAFVHPYAGSYGYWQDPTHCNGLNEASWQYFDPKHGLYEIYKPKPFETLKGYPIWSVNGNMEVVFKKITEEEGRKRYEELKSKTILFGPKEDPIRGFIKKDPTEE